MIIKERTFIHEIYSCFVANSDTRLLNYKSYNSYLDFASDIFLEAILIMARLRCSQILSKKL